MARYSQEFKQRAVARLLPPESSPIEMVSREMVSREMVSREMVSREMVSREMVSREIGVSVDTLEMEVRGVGVAGDRSNMDCSSAVRSSNRHGCNG